MLCEEKNEEKKTKEKTNNDFWEFTQCLNTESIVSMNLVFKYAMRH